MASKSTCDYDNGMKSFYKLTNEIRHYAWGHHSDIPDFLGIPNTDNEPFAELWMGAHPSAPSRIETDNMSDLSLEDWISSDTEIAMGPDITSQYGRLPFLFKLLAAGDALSIQAHPSKKMAEEGFLREDEAGIPRDAPNRNYRDNNHKPEIIMALTPFSAMIGFREPVNILRHFSELQHKGSVTEFLTAVSDRLKHSESEALQIFLNGLLSLDTESKKSLLESAAAVSKETQCGWDRLQRLWVDRLSVQFPGDIGVLAPLFLHVLEIQPGEALYQPAGVLHAYLEGFGMELMANSDNVLRGGLTKKHIDVPELMKILEFEASNPEILNPDGQDKNRIMRYPTPAREFSLGLVDVGSGKGSRIESGDGPLIVLALEGEILLKDGTEELYLPKGSSAFIPWKAPDIGISGIGRGAIAGIGS